MYPKVNFGLITKIFAILEYSFFNILNYKTYTMKNLLFLSMFVMSAVIGYSQTVYDTAIRYRNSAHSFYEAMDTLISRAVVDSSAAGEENEAELLIRWRYMMGSRICNNVPVDSDMYAPMDAALNSYYTHISDYCSMTSGPTWQCTGPFNDYYGSMADYPGTCEYAGRIDAIWVDPSDSSHILIGSNGGGLWKTTTGGHTWTNITDGSGGSGSSVLAMAGVNQIAVNPSDHNTIYIALSGREESKKSGTYNLGIAYTTDGGSTWTQDIEFNDLVMGSTPGIAFVPKIAYMPGTQHIFATCDWASGGNQSRLFYKASPTDSWVEITPMTVFSLPSYYSCLDFDFTKTTPTKLVVTTNSLSGTSHMFIYTPGTSTPWVDLSIVLPTTTSSGWPTIYTQNDNDGPYKILVTSDDNAYLVFNAHNGADRASLLIKTPLSSFSPMLKNADLTGLYDPSTHSLTSVFAGLTDLAVSPSNPDILYATNYLYDFYYHYPASILQSTDGGLNFHLCTGSGHPDGRCLFIGPTTNTSDGINDVVYFGSDGGIRKKNYGDDFFHSITGSGLAITQFFGFGNTEADDEIMAAGAQDNGGFTYTKASTIPWNHFRAGDGYTAKFLGASSTTAVGEENYPSLYGLAFSSSSVTQLTVDNPSSAEVSGNNVNRPIYTDASNTTYIGYHHLWKTDNIAATSPWSNAFALGHDPIDLSLSPHPSDYVIADFFVNEHNPDTVYIVYKGAATLPNGSADPFGRLFRSFNSTAASPTWIDITPFPTASHCINSIAVDPNNSKRIWVGFGNVDYDYVGTSPSDMQYRVYHSDNAGGSGSWVDESTGLSALPVGKLLYRKGSDDELYAGTDIGVFKWNKAGNTWECFNLGLPACTVMDMEFNYCAGKLRIATFGRGIWETDLMPNNEVPGIITASETWNGDDRYLSNSIDIQAGATLTITGTKVHMPKNGVINVEPGGHLIIDHAVITNDCDQCMWQGIQVMGDNSLPQNTTDQGWVTIKNGSVIQHAITGVTNYGNSGGIIQVRKSSFINNHNAVTLAGYRYPSTGAPLPNWSYFDSSTFALDNDYKGTKMGLPMTRMVDLEGVNGLLFSGCSFVNRDTFAAQRGKGEGIHAMASGFSVGPHHVPYTLSSYTRSRFSGFINGIWTGGLLHHPVVSVDQTDFDSSGVGVNISAANNVSVTQCDFKIGNGTGVVDIMDGCYQNIGILSQNTTQYRIEDNSFVGSPAGLASTVYGWHNVGVAIGNTGAGITNTVYRCTFDSLTEGVFSGGDNTGVYILCNDFYNSTDDILITGAGLSCICPIQGSSFSPQYVAGNTFHNSDHNIVNNTGTFLVYYYDNTDADQLPGTNTGHVFVQGLNVRKSCTPTACADCYSNVIHGTAAISG